jgi:hypothetical protein
MSEPEIIDGEMGELVPYAAPASPTLFATGDPSEVVAKATQSAKVLADVIRDRHLYKTIGGKNHVYVEAWTLLGSMLGVFPVVEWTRPIEGGWEARVEARTLSGALVGAAEGQCTRSEKTWASRDDYALRSMAQTRATSRALRGPLGFIVVLAGYNATAAEEMPSDEAPRGRAPNTVAGYNAGPNPSASGNDTKKATQPQIARMMTLAGELDKKGVAPPEGETWGDYIVHYIKERWGHDSRKDLTRGQIEHLMTHLEEGVPF